MWCCSLGACHDWLGAGGLGVVSSGAGSGGGDHTDAARSTPLCWTTSQGLHVAIGDCLFVAAQECGDAGTIPTVVPLSRDVVLVRQPFS